MDQIEQAQQQQTDAIEQAAKDAADQFVVFTTEQVSEAWANSELSHIQLISTNKNFRALPTKTWDALLAMHLTIHKYETDFFDCDAYSIVFCGFMAWYFDVNGVARVMDNSGAHSYNAVLVSDDGKTCTWRKVEPQSDTFVGDPPAGITVTAPSGAYAAQSGFAVTT